MDWSDYDLGVLKPNYYASASVVIGGENRSSQKLPALTSSNDLIIHDGANHPYPAESTVDLQVLFKGEPVAEQELIVSISDQWSKTIYTDEKGHAKIRLPWDGQYVVEAVFTETASGEYNGKEYASIRHTATYCIKTISK